MTADRVEQQKECEHLDLSFRDRFADAKHVYEEHFCDDCGAVVRLVYRRQWQHVKTVEELDGGEQNTIEVTER